jgi:hypothetical protein
MTGTCCDAINSTYLSFRRRAKRSRRNLLLASCREAANPPLGSESYKSVRPTRLGQSLAFNFCISCVARTLSSASLLRPRMGLIVDRQHVLHGKVGVALSGGEPLVAQHFLDGTQVGAFLEQVCAESVT